jgi:ribosomal protein S18 acetylase RimI-like enzyme
MTGVDEVTLRPCSSEDAEALALVGSATFLESFAGILPGPAIVKHCATNNSPASFTKYLATPRVQAWMATTIPGDAPVGYAMLTPPDLPLPDITGTDIELKRIYLFSRFQGSGMGQKLMEAAIYGAREGGATRLLLGVYAGNARALRFYARNGFEQVGTRTFTVGDLVCDDFVLGRPV